VHDVIVEKRFVGASTKSGNGSLGFWKKKDFFLAFPRSLEIVGITTNRN
jgi:hypothetical protein